MAALVQRLRAVLGGASKAAQHRPIGAADLERMRVAPSGRPATLADNPGVRVEPKFVTLEEARAVVLECRWLLSKTPFGADLKGTDVELIDPVTKQKIRKLGTGRRVTGRPEPDSPAAPWGYGDEFDVDKVPPHLQKVLLKLQSHPSFAFGRPRDITINYRIDGFFRLDPHVDPAGDGPNVTILNLMSDAVLTFTPMPNTPAMPPDAARTRRTKAEEIGMRSWTDMDLDILLQPRDVLHFTGKARTEWGHAIRAGVEIGPPAVPQPVQCDWWGSVQYLNRRAPERISVVYAFEDRHPEAAAAAAG